MNTELDLRDKIAGMFFGSAAGDACGMPVETMRREEIVRLNDGTGVTFYMDPVQTRVEHTRSMKLGDTTDDWQLTYATAFSLLDAKGFDLHHQAATHIEELKQSTFGWGKSTTKSLEEINKGIREPDEPPLWPHEEKKPNVGCGNGVIMKISPFAALSALTGMDLVEEVITFGKMTHPDMRACIAAVPVYRFLIRALNEHPQFVFGIGDYYDSDIIPEVILLEHKHLSDEPTKNFLSQHMANLDLESLDRLIETAGVGFTAWQTASFTLGCYMRHNRDFEGAILEAVNAGGDTDTNASIVGALVGATIGYRNIPEKWKSIPAAQEALLLAERFVKTFKQS